MWISDPVRIGESKRHMVLWVLMILTWGLAMADALLAQEPRLDHLEHFSVEDGLSHSLVWDLHQDSLGFLWIATEGSLHRYDGYEFKTYKNDPDDPTSLSPGVVMKIFEDSKGILWFGTRTAAINRYDRGADRFIRYEHDPQDPKSLTPGYAWEFAEDAEGVLWVGTTDGLNRFDASSETFTRYTHDPEEPGSLSDTIGALVIDRAGDIWVGTDAGLDRLDPRSGTFVHHRHDPDDPASLSEDVVTTIYEDPGGTLWIGTFDGTLHRLEDREAGSFVRYPHGQEIPSDPSSLGILAIHEDRAGEIWLGRFGRGLSRFDRAAADRGESAYIHYHRDRDDPRSLSSGTIQDILEDQSGVLWIATRGGLDKLDRRREQFRVVRRLPGKERRLNANALTADRDGVLWIGSGGLSAFDRTHKRARHYRHTAGDSDGLPPGGVSAVLEDQQGTLWIGTTRGLARLDSSRRRFIIEPALENFHVLSLLEDSAGDVWAGTVTGLHRFVEGRHASHLLQDPENPSTSTDMVYGLHEDRSGRLWLGTMDGLVRVEPESGTLIRLDHESNDRDSLSHESVTAIYQDAAGVFWLGTYGGGLNRWDPEGSEGQHGTWRHYREKDGLANDKITSLLADDAGLLWLGTLNSLSRFDPATESFRNYDVEDGLPGGELHNGSAFRSSRGEMFFGGEGGLISFFPEQIEHDPVAPRVVFTEFHLADEAAPLAWRVPGSPLQQSITETHELTLDHRHKTFSLTFAALHFASPRKNRYAYRLEGYETDWVFTEGNQRDARYTNLDPGDYVFRVKASNKDGVWNESGAAIAITVLPSPWKSWWAKGLYALTCVLLIVLYLRAQQKKLQQERAIALRERTVAHRLREIDRLKDDFLANTSHELRTPLYGIVGLAESLADGVRGALPEAAVDDLAMVVSSGRRLTHLVNDILDFSKLRRDSLELFARPVELHALADVVLTLSRPLVGQKNLVLKNTIDPELTPAHADENRLQQILLNLVGNAIKFTDAGKVEVAAELAGEELVVRVVDTGLGIAPEMQDHIFEAFGQTEASEVRAAGGTGLGLKITRDLVALHGGEIWVDSTPGEGSTFSFTLPASQEEVPSTSSELEPISQIQVLEPETEPSSRQSSMTEPSEDLPGILIVDDEPIIRQVLSNHLAMEHYRLLQAASGPEALELLAHEQTDLVLLDIMMPRMSGYEVCRKIREKHSLEELPVIFLSAKNQLADLMTGFAEGANDYLTKPIARGELLTRVGTHLELLAVHREQAREVKILRGLLPICCQCSKIREEDGGWRDLESYISSHSEASFSHGFCPDCAREFMEEHGMDSSGILRDPPRA